MNNSYRLYILLLFFSVSLLLQSKEHPHLLFENLELGEEPISSPVYAISQDEDGFMWFGTSDGLCRYDGYHIRSFRHSSEDTTSLSSSSVSAILKDNRGRLWLGTARGLDLYQPSTQTFLHLHLDRNSRGRNTPHAVYALMEDRKGCIWVASDGLYCISPGMDEIRYFSIEGESDNRNIIRSMMEDVEGNIWLGTFDGLIKLSLSGKMKHYDVRELTPTSPENNLTLSLHMDPSNYNILWVGTETGLHRFNMMTGKFISFSKQGNGHLSHNTVKCLQSYSDSGLLVGTDNGLNFLNTRDYSSSQYPHDHFNQLSICNDVISDIFRDRDGNLWFGTADGVARLLESELKVDVHDLEKPSGGLPVTGAPLNTVLCSDDGTRFLHFKDKVIEMSPDGTKQQLSFDGRSDMVIYMTELDRYGILWAGTSNSLWYKCRGEDVFHRIHVPGMRFVNTFTLDAEGGLWVDLLESLCRFTYDVTPEGKLCNLKFTKFKGEQPAPKEYIYTSTFSGDGKTIWTMTRDYVIHSFDIHGNETGSYTLEDPDTGIKCTRIKGCVGTHTQYMLTNVGIFCFDPADKSFRKFPIASISGSSIHSLDIDRFGHLWAGTRKTLVWLDPENGSCRLYDLTRFLGEKGISQNAIHADAQGNINIGGSNRYVTFNPARTYEEGRTKDISFVDFKVNGKFRRWDIGTDGAPEVRLRHNEASFEIFFSLFEYQPSTDEVYSYRLRGLEDSWVTIHGNNSVSYSHLAPGHYSFEVQGGTKGEVKKMRIRILPPWWLSWYAGVFYFLVLSAIIFLFWYASRMRAKLTAEIRLEQLRHDAQEQLIQYKIRFFTNISHEFRTPLTLILGPLEELRSQVTTPEAQAQLTVMKDNAHRLLRLVNQIMDFSRIEKGNVTLHPSDGDLIHFLKRIYSMFISEATSRKMSYSFVSQLSSYETSFDDDKLEKIIYNLLSNAFKYTPDLGTVRLFVDRAELQGNAAVEIKVEDSGKDIPEEEQRLIFKRFYQSPSSDGAVTGTGIGLSLVKDFVDLFGGEISVSNNPISGVTFRLLLPLQEKTWEDADVVELEDRVDVSGDKKYTILVVDDNPDMCTFMQGALEQDYNVILAYDGAEGLQKLRRFNPDVVISDQMMPVMDGLEFCRTVKEDETTSHIPFILLTAKDGYDNICTGLKAGADDYISKPFNMQVLKLKLEKILHARESMQEHLRTSLRLGVEKDVQGEKPLTNPFVEKVLQVIDENLSSEKLDVAFLADNMKMQKQQLYRKVKALTGLTVVELIRSVRLKEAARKLIETENTVSEIMYSVGFSNNSYFSKSFLEQFNQTPTDYRKEHRPA